MLCDDPEGGLRGEWGGSPGAEICILTADWLAIQQTLTAQCRAIILLIIIIHMSLML